MFHLKALPVSQEGREGVGGESGEFVLFQQFNLVLIKEVIDKSSSCTFRLA